MPDYEAVIGLEVHVHLNTATKLFCACPNSFGDDPNSNVCEICGGMPGVLPTLNRKAVELASRMAMAVEAEINQQSRFARKNYFYPDMPRNYQISQFESPLCSNGHLDIELNGQTRRIGINRIHIEDDAGKLVHPTGETRSYIDLNRSGAPLIEIVSEPDLRSSAEAVAYLKALHAIVVSLGVSNGNMEEGSFRCDANVSLRPKGSATLGTRAEIKNLNSFRNVQRGIEYEIARQSDILDEGGKVVQETRLYDAERDLTLGMRGKEDAQDYRYFPDPDLLDVLITDADLTAWRDSQPELPAARLARYVNTLSLPDQDARQLAADPGLALLFDAAIALYDQPKKIANLLLGPVLRQINQHDLDSANLALRPEQLAQLAEIIDTGLISSKIAADLLPDLLDGQTMPAQLVQERGLAQVSDFAAIEQAVLKVIEANPEEVAAYKGGKTKLLSFFVGQIMREMRGKANPAMVNELLDKFLK